MLIRYKLPAANGINLVEFGQSRERVYDFKPNDKGEFVCDVDDEGDARTLLAIAEGFEEFGAKPAAPAPVDVPFDPTAFLDELDMDGLVGFAEAEGVKLDSRHDEAQARHYLKGLVLAKAK